MGYVQGFVKKKQLPASWEAFLEPSGVNSLRCMKSEQRQIGTRRLHRQLSAACAGSPWYSCCRCDLTCLLPDIHGTLHLLRQQALPQAGAGPSEGHDLCVATAADTLASVTQCVTIGLLSRLLSQFVARIQLANFNTVVWSN